MLSSDILEQQFGETKIVILKQDDHHRIIQTVVRSTNEIVELSLVTFDAAGSSMFPEIHEQIINGASIGKAFKQAGVRFVRDTTSTWRQMLPDALKTYLTNQQAATIVDVDIFVGNKNIHYCHIVELYSGAVKWPGKLTELPAQLTRHLDILSDLLKD